MQPLEQALINRIWFQIGWAEGFAEGALAEAKKILRFLGEDAFGAPSAQIASQIESLNELPQVEDLIMRIRASTSWEMVLGLPACSCQPEQRLTKRKSK